MFLAVAIISIVLGLASAGSSIADAVTAAKRSTKFKPIIDALTNKLNVYNKQLQQVMSDFDLNYNSSVQELMSSSPQLFGRIKDNIDKNVAQYNRQVNSITNSINDTQKQITEYQNKQDVANQGWMQDLAQDKANEKQKDISNNNNNNSTLSAVSMSTGGIK